MSKLFKTKNKKTLKLIMKIPDKNDLTNNDMLMLYKHDTQEQFSSEINKTSYSLYQDYLDFFLRFIKQNFNFSSNILDVGCAQSNFSLSLAERGYKVTALDINQNFIDYSRLKYQSGDIKFMCSNFLELKVEEKFDLIILQEILEHTSNPSALLDKAYKLLAPEGKVIITTPRQEYFRNKLPSYLEVDHKLVGKEFFPDGDDHYFFFKDSELTNILQGSNLEAIEIMRYRSFFIAGDLKCRFLHKLFKTSQIIFIENMITKIFPLKSLFSQIFIFAEKNQKA